ncbi:MAG: proteinsorting protein [Phycisphaerales bacterium]|nr:proteinsorting protein [Phycisphaerales bacterium]
MKSFLIKSVLSVAVMTGFAASAKAAVILVDYGDTFTTDFTSGTWNNQGSATNNNTLTNLLDTAGTATGIQAAAVGFNGYAGTGGVTPMTGTAATTYLTNANTAVSASTDYIFTGGTSTITLTGLNLQSTYTFGLFGDRNGAGPRTTSYTATGVNTATGSQDSSFNTANVVTLASIAPTPTIGSPTTGTIVLTVAVVAPNTATFAYLNALRIDSAATPEPASLTVLAGGGMMLLRRRRAR